MKKCFILFILVLLLFAGCRRKEAAGATETPVPAPRLTLTSPAEESSAADSSAANPGEAPAAVGPAAGTAETVRPARRAAETAVQPIKTVSLAAQEKLAFRTGTAPILPEDMMIGPVGDDYRKDPVLVPVEFFLSELKSGRFSEEPLLESSRTYLKRVFEPIMEGKLFPESFRLGAPYIYEPGFATVNVRILGTPGRTAGSFSLEEDGNSWRISDINVDFEKLKIEYKKEFEVYEPQTYRWLELF